METATTIKTYEKETQQVKIVEDTEGDQYIQIIDEFYDAPICTIDCHQAEQLIKLLQQAVTDIK